VKSVCLCENCITNVCMCEVCACLCAYVYLHVCVRMLCACLCAHSQLRGFTQHIHTTLTHTHIQFLVLVFHICGIPHVFKIGILGFGHFF